MAEDMALQAMHLPPPPATVADIGGGPGRYPLWLADLVCVEGPAFLLDDLGPRLADPQDRRVVLATARALERVPELIGIGPHLLATAHSA
jgi:hypothetical protein